MHAQAMLILYTQAHAFERIGAARHFLARVRVRATGFSKRVSAFVFSAARAKHFSDVLLGNVPLPTSRWVKLHPRSLDFTRGRRTRGSSTTKPPHKFLTQEFVTPKVIVSKLC